MGVRPQRRAMIDVDLVEVGSESSGALDAPSVEPPVASEPAPAKPEPPSPQARLSHRVGLLACVVVVAVTAVVIGQVRGARNGTDALLGAAPPLATPLEEIWRVEAKDGWSVAADLLLTTVRSPYGADLRAHDLETGAQRWELPLADEGIASVRCPVDVSGPDGPLVVCQVFGFLGPTAAGAPGGSPPGRLLLVSAETGEVTQEWDLTPEHVGFAAFDGDLVLATAGLETVQVERISVREGATVWQVQVPGDTTAGIGARLTVENGLVIVGAPTTVVLDARDGREVGVWRSPTAAADPISAYSAARSGRGADPAALGSGATVEPEGRPWITSLPHGLGVRADVTQRSAPTQWYTPDGTAVGPVSGPVLEPEVSDGSVPEVVLVAAPGRSSVRGVDVAGEAVLWSLDTDDGLPVIRVDGQVILAGAGLLRAVDLRTGQELWRTDGDGLAQTHAVSDGTFVLVTGTVLGVGRTMSAVSLRDGSLLWRTPLPPDAQNLRVTGDRVVAVGSGVVIGLG